MSDSAGTESLRERLKTMTLSEIVAELQKRDEGQARLVVEFRRLAAEALENRAFEFDTGAWYGLQERQKAFEQAAQMIEDSPL